MLHVDGLGPHSRRADTRPPARMLHMTHTYELRTLDQLDGIGASKLIAPRWSSYEWPNASGLGKSRLGDSLHRGAYRLDQNKNNDGWWALDDLIRVITGFDRKNAEAGWYIIKAADLVKVMTVFRALGADKRLEICLPPEYMTIVDNNLALADQQVRKSVELEQRS